MEKKNSGEKINEMPGSEVSSYENSTSSDVENDILEDLGEKIKCLMSYHFEPDKEVITLVADTDEIEEECSEESDEECHSHSAIKSVSEILLGANALSVILRKERLFVLSRGHSTERKVL